MGYRCPRCHWRIFTFISHKLGRCCIPRCGIKAGIGIKERFAYKKVIGADGGLMRVVRLSGLSRGDSINAYLIKTEGIRPEGELLSGVSRPIQRSCLLPIKNNII
jgi:hypothetical protein